MPTSLALAWKALSKQFWVRPKSAAPKPAPRAYKMALDALGLQREEILFAPFAGCDVAGAKWFGYPTFWVNRLDLPAERLGVAPDAVGRNLADLVRFTSSSGS